MLPRGRLPLLRGRGDRATTVLLSGIVLVALALRLTGLTWGLPWVFHPDENHYVAVAQQMVRSGDPNPGYFENPSLLTYLIAGALVLLRGLGPPGLVEANATVLARLNGALLGTAGVVLVFLVGRRLFDRPVGLAPALFLAVAFLHVRDSHYGVNDVPATTVLTLALVLAARAAGRPTTGRLALAAAGRRAGLVGLLAAALAQPLANDLLHNRIILQTDTRILANAWVQAELPPRSHLLVQTYALRDVSRQYRTYTPNTARHRIELLRGPRPDLLDSFVENDVNYFVASSFVYERDLLDPRRAVEPELRYRRLFHDLERRAPLVARFSPGHGGAEVPHSQESMFTPFWNLEQYERPGPTLRVYTLAPLAGRGQDGR